MNRYTILSVTNNYLYGKSSILEYTTSAKSLAEEVERLHVNKDTSTIDPDDFLAAPTLSKKNADDKSIRFIEDFQLVLLRHWNLYDSMFHSTYPATKLGVWKEKGRQKLTNLLVKMGFPQRESKQIYRQMDLDFKRNLPAKLIDLAPKYNMPDIVFPSFERNYGYITTFSASDVVYSVSALLDCGGTWLAKNGVSGYEQKFDTVSDQSTMLMSKRAKHAFQDMSATGDGGLVGAGVGTKSTAAGIATSVLSSLTPDDSRTDWLQNFYMAYDALSAPNLVQHGVLVAMHYQKLLVQTAMGMLERKSVQSLKYFQIAILKGSGGDTREKSESSIFGTSVSLLYRLTTFLMDAYQIYKDRKLPFIAFALNEETDSYLVLGRSTTTRKNPFGIAFKTAAKQTGIEIRDDYFDSSCITLQREDLDAFLDNLQMVLL